MIAIVGMSYGQALTYPGNASWQVRSVEWVRDHGGSGLVNAVENWWYARNTPTGATPPPGTLPSLTGSGAPVTATAPRPPPLPLLPTASRLPGEARWVPSAQRTGRAPAMYTGYFRPDPAHPSQIVGVAWINQALVTSHLIAGTREPGGTGWRDHAQVPPEMRPELVAAFNSGWKMHDIQGGYYAEGRTAVPLRDGAASVVIDSTGRVTVGQWGRDVAMSPQVLAVRQNLDLIIDQSQPVPGLAENPSGAWGNTGNQSQYTWRSGLGTDRAGNLVYVAGDKLTLSALAQAMVTAGVTRGMELDIHPAMVTFIAFHPAAGAAYGVTSTKLLPGMHPPSTRYLNPDQRDFLAVTLRSPADSGAAPGRPRTPS
jgi:hypothetical protein